MFPAANKASFVLIIILSIILLNSSACTNDGESQFGIYLVETGELVISEHHIERYHWDTHTIKLNEEGIKKWNSYMTYKSIPKLAESLFKKNFSIKVKGKEIYRGQFYSGASSASYSGVVIMDSLFKLDEELNTISINFGYPQHQPGSADDPRNNNEIFNVLKEAELL